LPVARRGRARCSRLSPGEDGEQDGGVVDGVEAVAALWDGDELAGVQVGAVLGGGEPGVAVQDLQGGRGWCFVLVRGCPGG
jgi:hypothetical protein